MRLLGLLYEEKTMLKQTTYQRMFNPTTFKTQQTNTYSKWHYTQPITRRRKTCSKSTIKRQEGCPWTLSLLLTLNRFFFSAHYVDIFKKRATKAPVLCHVLFIPADIYLFKINNRNNRNRRKICSMLTIKTPKWSHLG